MTTPFLRFALALALVVAAIAAAACLAAPFGIDPAQTAIGFAAFAVGLLVPRGPTPSRSAIVATGIAFAAVAGATAWSAGSIAPWLARSWPIAPIPVSEIASATPWPGGLFLASVMFVLGFAAARAWHAAGGGGFGAAALGGVIAGCVFAALIAFRTIGPRGALVLSGVLALVVASCLVVATRIEAPPARGFAPILAAVATGMTLGTVQSPFEIAAGGTLVAVVVGAVIAAGGALVGSLARPSLQRAGRGARVAARLALAIAIGCVALAFPSADEIVLASARVAEGAGGVLPSFDMLHPLPLCVALAAACAGSSGVFDSTRGLATVLLFASIARVLPRHELLIATTFLLAIVLASIQAIATVRATGPRLVPIATAAAVVAWALVCAGVRRDGTFELDGARVAVRDGAGLDAGAAALAIDGVPLPLAPPAVDSVDRLLRTCLALRDEPEACLVLGPGGGAWVERSLLASSARVDYVTPCAAEAEFVRKRAADPRRLRVFVMPARRFLAAATESYERILICPAEPPWHRAGMTLTQEFRELAVARLSEEGIAAQLFEISGMQPANVVFRLMGDAFLAVADGVLIVDHPRSIDPQFALLFGRGELRFSVDLTRRRLAEIAAAAPDLAGAEFDVREILAGVFADTRVLRFSSRVSVPNRDARPWMAASLHARVIPDPLYVPSNLANLIGYHAFVESRIDGPAADRQAFLAAARRDHEAVHHWLVRRAGAPGLFLADAGEAPGSPQEIDALVQCLAKSPDSDLFRRPIRRAAHRLDAEGRRGEARGLLDRAAAIEERISLLPSRPFEAPCRQELCLARATLYARHGRRVAAEALLTKLLDSEAERTVARRELAALLAYAGRDARLRARSLLAEPDTTADESDPAPDRAAIAHEWLEKRIAAPSPFPLDAAARYRAFPRRE